LQIVQAGIEQLHYHQAADIRWLHLWSLQCYCEIHRRALPSNHENKRGSDFQLFMIDEDGSNLEQITTESIFNFLPMFSPYEKQLVFSSNRNNGGGRATNLFITDWID